MLEMADNVVDKRRFSEIPDPSARRGLDEDGAGPDYNLRYPWEDDDDEYWQRMRDEGFWKDGTGWTDKGMREMMK
jgi:hypothetical protein